MAHIRSLASANSELMGGITARVIAGTNEVAFCFRGLEFARWSQEGIVFGHTIRANGLGKARSRGLRV
jgi:hypothetical protein